ncbi:hypothetical protein ACOSQ2_010447 [Xanthoceras sorbifolium]
MLIQDRILGRECSTRRDSVRPGVLGQKYSAKSAGPKVLSHEEVLVLGQKEVLDQQCSTRKECSVGRSTQLEMLGQEEVFGQKCSSRKECSARPHKAAAMPSTIFVFQEPKFSSIPSDSFCLPSLSSLAPNYYRPGIVDLVATSHPAIASPGCSPRVPSLSLIVIVQLSLILSLPRI